MSSAAMEKPNLLINFNLKDLKTETSFRLHLETFPVIIRLMSLVYSIIYEPILIL